MNRLLLTLCFTLLAALSAPALPAAADPLTEGRAFLERNTGNPAVVQLPSGLQYQVLRAGSGRSPHPDGVVRVNYRGWTLDGREFDSSGDTPRDLALNTVLLGWRQALPLMKEGAVWKLFLEPDLAFGKKGPMANQVVIYQLELVKVLP